MSPDDPGVRYLLGSDDPAVRHLAKTDLLDEASDEDVAESPKIRTLLDDQGPDGGFGVTPYTKWTGAHWRVVSLVELGVPPDTPGVLEAAETVLDWWTSDRHTKEIRLIDGRTRAHASQEGNALAACARLGLADDPRVQTLAGSLIEWQWPDCGWNCDRHPEAGHSSFHESITPLWGLIEYANATGDSDAGIAAERAAEFFLAHRLFRSHRTGEVIHPEWLKLHYPPYWHYDVLHGLLVLSRLEPLTDPRLDEALDHVTSKRRPDGTWPCGAKWWSSPGSGSKIAVDVVDWGRRGPSEMITLNAFRVLKAAGRV